MTRAAGGDWSPDLTEAVRKAYIEQGLSAAQTARQLGEGLTRNAVIAGAHRRGWSKGAPGGVTQPKVQVRVNPIPSADDAPGVAKFALRHPVTESAKLAVDMEPGECRWPVGHESGQAQRFCASRVEGNGPYCSGHRGKAYQKAKPCES